MLKLCIHRKGQVSVMNKELEKLLLDSGATMVGFAKIQDFYGNFDENEPRTEDSVTEPINLAQYPLGISILLHYPQDVIKNISEAPTKDYFNSYQHLNNELDKLAIKCADYITAQGFHAFPQTVSLAKEYGIFRTLMPHKTVAVNAGMGWIGNSINMAQR